MLTKIVLVGGFLGAGKTTLLGKTAHKLGKAGKQVGLITNDQASELVDTVFLEYTDAAVSEVSGSCFCCNFPGFISAIEHITQNKAINLIVAEPVGSCTDLSATILQPLKQKFKDKLAVAPLSVLVDPRQLLDILDGRQSALHPSALYIINKQLEEADIIVINKIDLLSFEEVEDLKNRAAAKWPQAKIHAISAYSEIGLDDWLNDVLQGATAGANLAEVDYDTYAEGEAVLGWLNTTVKLASDSADWDNIATSCLNTLSQRFGELKAAVGHVKLLIKTDNGFVVGNITGPKPALSLRGSAGVSKTAMMTLNARAEMDPDRLKSIVMEELSKVCSNKITFDYVALNCLQPGRPNPTYRYDSVVG